MRPDVNSRFVPLASLTDLDLVRFGRELVLLVCTVAEGHHGGPPAPAPGLNHLPLNNNEVRPVLGRSYHNIRRAHTITSLPIIVLGS